MVCCMRSELDTSSRQPFFMLYISKSFSLWARLIGARLRSETSCPGLLPHLCRAVSFIHAEVAPSIQLPPPPSPHSRPTQRSSTASLHPTKFAPLISLRENGTPEGFFYIRHMGYPQVVRTEPWAEVTGTRCAAARGHEDCTRRVRTGGPRRENRVQTRTRTHARTARARDIGACGHRHARKIRGEGHNLDKVVSAGSV